MEYTLVPPGGSAPRSHPGRKWCLFIGLGLLIFFGGFLAQSLSSHTDQAGVKIVRLEGKIDAGDRSDGSVAGSEVIGKEIRDAADDPMVEAIVLRVNSPGGTPSGAQEIIRDLDYAKTKKPVVVSMGDMATSAAYYVSSHADAIYANPDTFTAGIGVIWEFSDISRWNENEGYNVTIVKSGVWKDMGNPSRHLSPDEQAYAQSIVDASFNGFISDVTSHRTIARSDIDNGRVVRGADAIRLNIIDKLGNLNDAIDGAKQLARNRA